MVTIIGIAGGSGSGKTTIARKLRQRIGENHCGMISHDEYYKPLDHLTSKERAAINFDCPLALDTALLRQHLETLRSGITVELPVYCFETHTRKVETRMVTPQRFFIVDGVLLFVDRQLRRVFDFKIFVEAKNETRYRRRLHRDTVARGRTPSSVKSQWDNTVAPMHAKYVEPSSQYADVILSTEHSSEDSIDHFANHIVNLNQ